MEMGCLDPFDSQWRNFHPLGSLLLATSPCEFSRSYNDANSRSNRLHRWCVVSRGLRPLPSWSPMGRLSIVHPHPPPSDEYSAWRSAHVIVTMTLGLAMIVAFCIFEAFFAPYPMIPPKLFQNKVSPHPYIVNNISAFQFSLCSSRLWPGQIFTRFSTFGLWNAKCSSVPLLMKSHVQ